MRRRGKERRGEGGREQKGSNPALHCTAQTTHIEYVYVWDQTHACFQLGGSPIHAPQPLNTRSTLCALKEIRKRKRS